MGVVQIMGSLEMYAPWIGLLLAVTSRFFSKFGCFGLQEYGDGNLDAPLFLEALCSSIQDWDWDGEWLVWPWSFLIDEGGAEPSVCLLVPRVRLLMCILWAVTVFGIHELNCWLPSSLYASELHLLTIRACKPESETWFRIPRWGMVWGLSPEMHRSKSHLNS